jgi:hypothetical protein
LTRTASSRSSQPKAFSRAQAKGITEALKELDVTTLATKADHELALAKQTTTLLTWMTGNAARAGRARGRALAIPRMIAIERATEDLDTSSLATKGDLKDAVVKLEIVIHQNTARQIVWMTGALFAQGAFVVALLQLLG